MVAHASFQETDVLSSALRMGNRGWRRLNAALQSQSLPAKELLGHRGTLDEVDAAQRTKQTGRGSTRALNSVDFC